jgi:hypothetical protein
MEKNNKNLGKDELQRVLLMMKYDSKKTLTENKDNLNKNNLFEQSTLNAKDFYAAKSFDVNLTLGVDANKIKEFVGWTEEVLEEVKNDVTTDEGLVDSLDRNLGGMMGDNMEQHDMDTVMRILKTYQRAYVKINDKFYPAMEVLRATYAEDESGDNLGNDLFDPVGINTPSVTEFAKKAYGIYINSYNQWINIMNSTKKLATNPEENKKKIKYTACPGFPLKLHCVNSEIGKVQKCLGLKQDNALGPITQKALKDVGIELPLTADGAKKACSPEQSTPKLTTIPTQQTNEPELKENYKVIKKQIRENLIKTKENKKNILIEQSIVNKRFSIIIENRELKTKSQKEKFYLDVLVEMKRLNDQGFESKLITESFFDIISGFFGKGGTGILQTIKEYFGNWLIGKLGVDTKGWIGGTIVRAIGNLDIADIPKLTNCTFTTKLLSKSLAENAVSKLQTAAGLEGTLSNIMRNTLVETLEENSTFMVKIEEALGSVLCPLISNVSGKLEDAASAMKEKAIAK